MSLSAILLLVLYFFNEYDLGYALCYSLPNGYGCPAGSVCVNSVPNDDWYEGSCIDCSPGSYCPGGFIKSRNSDNPTTEIKCPQGTANNVEGAKTKTECKVCAIGRYATAGSSDCTHCSNGYIAPVIGSSECTACEAGKISNGGKTCEKCDAGEYSSTAASVECTPCSKGMYSALAGSTKCETCPVSKYTQDTGLKECSDCDSGKYTVIIGASSPTECMKCPWGTYNPSPGSRCTNCPSGTYNENTGSNSLDACTACPAGRFQDGTGKNFCNLCSADTYQPNVGADACVDCPNGATSAPGATECVKASVCKAGTYYYGSQCLTCPAGTYSGDGATYCTKCENNDRGNKTTSLQGSKSMADCFIVCPEGYFAGSSGQCEPCNPGTFNREKGQPSCTPCVAGKYQEQRGQQECIDCARGTYSVSSGTPVCHFCFAGKYGLLTGATSEAVCVDCQAGYYSFIGSTMCKQAPPGSFTNVSSSKEYTYCTPGRYQPDSGQTSCRLTGPGYYTGAFAAVQLPCPAGTANALPGATSKADCTPCGAGTVSNVGSANCTSCEGRGMVANEAQNACIVDTKSLFSSESIIEELVQKGIALMVAGSVAALYVLVAALVQYRREKFALSTDFSIGAVPRLMVIAKSFISGLTFGSEVFLVATMMSEAPKLASTMIAFRCLHTALCALISIALFGGSGWMKTVENFGITDARNLYKQMDLGFVGAHVPLVGMLVLLSCADVDLVPLWPWKKSAFHSESQGYPNMNIMTRSLVVNAIQSIVSMVCQVIYLSSTHDESTSSNQARALFASNITFTSIGVTIGMLSLFLKKGILVRMEKERGAEQTGSPVSANLEGGLANTVNPMLSGGLGAAALPPSLKTVQSDNPLVQEIIKVLNVDARLEEAKNDKARHVVDLEHQVHELKRQLNTYAAKASRSSTLDSTLEMREATDEDEVEMGQPRHSEFDMSLEDVYAGHGKEDRL